LTEGLFSKGFTHGRLEAMPVTMTVLALLAILVGSVIELVPFVTANTYSDSIYKDANVKHYTPLQQAGRDIYVREGCYTCHSQMIRKLDFDVVRYGEASKIEESMWDHPFQWGSKRTGPDLARLGQKYPHLWHYRHMINPRDVNPESIMPAYPWLQEAKTNFAVLSKKVSVLKTLGVPYTDEDVAQAEVLARAEAAAIVADLRQNGVQQVDEDREIVALIAYLQILGRQSTQVQQVGVK
jgi:cytochrome c oxidase cbb3-type subunit I/II